jgi:SAM-dependent methyltransferase
MSQLLIKGLTLAKRRIQRVTMRQIAKASPLGPRAVSAVAGFQVPSCPPRLRNVSRDQLVEWYWRMHPRFNFFKGVPPDAQVLDIGAGGGGLPFWRGYLAPNRSDVKLYGVDLVEPLTKTLYEEFQVADLNAGIPFPELAFDAVIASHVLEHVVDARHTFSQIAKRLRVGGLAYIETPAPSSKTLPSAAEYRDAGWPMMISNFHDDVTHRDTVDLPTLAGFGEANGLRCIQQGHVNSPYLEDALIAQGCAWKDSEVLLYGYWSATKWAQYAVFEKVAA